MNRNLMKQICIYTTILYYIYIFIWMKLISIKYRAASQGIKVVQHFSQWNVICKNLILLPLNILVFNFFNNNYYVKQLTYTSVFWILIPRTKNYNISYYIFQYYSVLTHWKVNVLLSYRFRASLLWMLLSLLNRYLRPY